MKATITIPGTIAQVEPKDLAFGFLVSIGTDGSPQLTPQLVLVTASPMQVVFDNLTDDATYSGTYQAVDETGNALVDVKPVSFSFVASLPTVTGIVATGQPTVVIS